MKAKTSIIFLFVLFIIGCGRESHPITDVDIYRGTDGLTIEFIGNTPPDEVFENTPFPFGIKLVNEGAYNIADGYITFSLEEDYLLLDENSMNSLGDRVRWEGSKPQIRFSLNGKSIEVAEGEEEIITLRGEAKKLEELSQIHESSILTTACYGYETNLVATVCVDTDLYDLKKIVKPCEIKDLRFSNQGAPVAITGIEVKMVPMDTPSRIRPQFLINIENKGDGLVTKRSDEIISRACSQNPLNYSDFGIVDINVFLGGERKQLNCNIANNQNSGVVKLRDNRGIARCILEEGIDEREGTYASPLSVELDYGYTYTISRNIIIKKPPKY